MELPIVIGIAVGAAAIAAVAARASDGSQSHVTTEQREQLQQAKREAGLEGKSVRGEWVPGVGWRVEQAGDDPGGFTNYVVEETPSER